MTEPRSTLIEELANAKRASAPLLAVETADPGFTLAQIREWAEAKQFPLLRWDIQRAIVPLNDAGEASLRAVLGVDKNGDYATDPASLTNPSEALSIAAEFPGRDEANPRAMTTLVMLFAHRYLETHAVVQGIWNLRDTFKADFRTLILLGPSFDLPPELREDVLVLRDPRPSPEALARVARDLARDAGLPEPGKAELEGAVDATLGLGPFAAEQAMALSIRPGGIDQRALWNRKVQMLDGIRGISVLKDPVTLDDVAGLANIKQYLRRIAAGRDAPRAYFVIDEID